MFFDTFYRFLSPTMWGPVVVGVLGMLGMLLCLQNVLHVGPQDLDSEAPKPEGRPILQIPVLKEWR